MAVKQDVNVGLVAFVGVVGAMLLLIIVWGVQAWYAYEVDAINQNRYASDNNTDWISHKDEQYANIGDPIGNATIYAAGMTAAERDKLPAGFGYRYLSDKKDVAAIPIHAAMAEVIRENGGPDQSVARMRAIDHDKYIQIVNEAYAADMTPLQAEPQNAPTPGAAGGVRRRRGPAQHPPRDAADRVIRWARRRTFKTADSRAS